MIRSRRLAVLSLLAVGLIFPSIAQGQTVRDTQSTVAGELKITQLDEGQLGSRYSVTLNGNVVLNTDGNDRGAKFSEFPVPNVLRRFKSPIAPFDEVIVFQQNMWGNACNGGPLWFLGVKKDGTYAASAPIDFCGGPAPRIRQGGGAIMVTLPGGPPNSGKGYVAGENWVYRNGEVSRAKGPNKR